MIDPGPVDFNGLFIVAWLDRVFIHYRLPTESELVKPNLLAVLGNVLSGFYTPIYIPLQPSKEKSQSHLLLTYLVTYSSTTDIILLRFYTIQNARTSTKDESGVR